MNSTRNYDLFKMIPGNRLLNPTNYKNIKESVQKKNLLHASPILVSEEMLVIDGQHRVQVAKDLGVEIFYITLLVEDKEDLLVLARLLNSNQKIWTSEDYLLSNIRSGNEEYIALDNFRKAYGITISLAIAFLSTDKGYPQWGAKRDSKLMKAFREGAFKIKNLSNSTEHIEMIKDFAPYVDAGVWRDKRFISAVKAIEKLANHTRLIHKLSLSRGKIRRQVSFVAYVRELGDIYNFRNITKIHFSEELVAEKEDESNSSNGETENSNNYSSIL